MEKQSAVDMAFCIDCGRYLHPDEGNVVEHGVICDECFKYRKGNKEDEEHRESKKVYAKRLDFRVWYAE